MKLVGNMQWAREWIKPASPNTKTVFRWHTNEYDAYLKHPQGLRAGARLYLSRFLDSLIAEADWIDYAEGTNELIGTGDPEDIKIKVEFECYFALALQEAGFPARPCLLNPGVGNPQHGYETQLLRPAAQTVVAMNGCLGGHTYIGFRAVDHYCTLSDAAKHFSMRPLLSWDPEFRSAGIYPDYVFTEGGGIYIHPTAGMPSSKAGWRYRETCAGDWTWYKWGLLEFRRKCNEWNATHGNRCLGQCIFTFGGGGWDNFIINGSQLMDLAAAVTT